MKKALCAMLAAGAAASLPAPTLAADAGLTLEQVYDAGRCIVDRDRRAALSLVVAQPIEGDVVDLSGLSPDLRDRCASAIESASPLNLRGAIAQALFFRDFEGFGLQPGRGVSLVNLNIPVQDSPPGSDMVDMYRWADCVVRNDAGHSEALMRSRIGSRQEAAAIAGLSPYMQACAPEGADLRVSAAQLRGVVAQAAYHSMYRYWTRDLASTRGGE